MHKIDIPKAKQHLPKWQRTLSKCKWSVQFDVKNPKKVKVRYCEKTTILKIFQFKTKWDIFFQIFVTIWTLKMSKYRNSILELMRRPRSGFGRYSQTDHQPKVVVIQKNDESLWTCLRSKVSERLSCDSPKKMLQKCPIDLDGLNLFCLKTGIWKPKLFKF